MTQFKTINKLRHKATVRPARVIAVKGSSIGLIFQVEVGGTLLVVHEDDLEPY
jgi:hypothetical protein